MTSKIFLILDGKYLYWKTIILTPHAWEAQISVLSHCIFSASSVVVSTFILHSVNSKITVLTSHVLLLHNFIYNMDITFPQKPLCAFVFLNNFGEYLQFMYCFSIYVLFFIHFLSVLCLVSSALFFVIHPHNSDWIVFWLFRIFLKYFVFLFSFSVECLTSLSEVYLNSRNPLCTVSYSFPSLFSLLCFHSTWWNFFLLMLHILQFSLWFHVFHVVFHCFLFQDLSVLFPDSEREGKKKEIGKFNEMHKQHNSLHDP